MQTTANMGGACEVALLELPLEVEGMTCASCVGRLETALYAVDGVVSAPVNLATNRAQVSFEADKVSAKALSVAVEAAGFSVVEHVHILRVEGLTCAACVTAVEAALNRINGVVQASANLTSGRVTVAAIGENVSAQQLIAAVQGRGYRASIFDAEEGGHEDRAESRGYRQRLRLIVALVLTLPLALDMLFGLLGVSWRLSALAQLCLAAPVQFWVGWPFYQAAYRGLMHRTGNMDLLVSLGTSAAFGLSVFLMLIDHPRGAHLYFEASAIIITLILLGRLLEARAKRRASSAIRALSALRPDVARVLNEGEEEEVSVAELVLGHLVVVRPGERIPVDGIIREGASDVDESLLSGESVPVHRRVGEKVTGGSLNGDGRLCVEVTALGSETTLAKIVRLVESAQASKAPVQRLVDRVCAVFVPVVVVIALVTAIAWWLLVGDIVSAVIAGATVLVVACPCALGLATPTAIIVGIGAAARAGILIKDAQALELIHRASVVVFDKTGTLTKGRLEVVDIVGQSAQDEELLCDAASVQAGSEHPLAGAVRRCAEQRGLTLKPSIGFKRIPGQGVRATIDGRVLSVGSRQFMQAQRVDASSLEQRAVAFEKQGATVIWVWETTDVATLLGFIALADELRPEAKTALQRLHSLGVRTIMLTGDNQQTAEVIAARAGIETVIAQVLPDEKAALVADLKGDNERVAMVGDGVNDAPALARADVGIAMGGGADVAMESAGITLMRSDLNLVADAIAISRATNAKIRQNLFWAFIYNTIGIPFAAFGVFTPVMAGAAMSLSSICVVTNALLLKRWRAR